MFMEDERKTSGTEGMAGQSPMPLLRSAATVPSRIELAGLVSQMRRERFEYEVESKVDRRSQLDQELKRYGQSLDRFSTGEIAQLQDVVKNPTLQPSARSAASRALKNAGMDPADEAATAARIARQLEVAMRRLQQRLYSALQDMDPTRIRDALHDANEIAETSQSLRGRFVGGQGNAIAAKADAMRDSLHARVEQHQKQHGVRQADDPRQAPAWAAPGMR
jgi:hypothetical protein